MNRTPPVDVLRELRREVGFGCPVPGCGNPFLTWHHFDPPWRGREHHEPAGMIALCREHADQADAGAFTDEQLRAFKTDTEHAREVGARFNWMRQQLLAVVGGNFYLETPTPVHIQGIDIVAFSRDEDGHWILNVNMPRSTQEAGLVVAENFWISRGEPEELVCPPMGRLVSARYANGDSIKIEFVDDLDAAGLDKRYPDAPVGTWPIPTPITVVEITMRLPDANIDFGPRLTKIGNTSISNSFMGMCQYGLFVG